MSDSAVSPSPIYTLRIEIDVFDDVDRNAVAYVVSASGVRTKLPNRFDASNLCVNPVAAMVVHQNTTDSSAPRDSAWGAAKAAQKARVAAMNKWKPPVGWRNAWKGTDVA